jgi:methanogenic corrinoid protein MtbC1
MARAVGEMDGSDAPARGDGREDGEDRAGARAPPVIERLIGEYNEALIDTDRDRAMRIVHDAVEQGITPEQIVFQVVLPSMERMIPEPGGDGVSIAQHFITSQIGEAVTTEMIARFEKSPQVRGRVVIGTVHGDMHSLGKKIVTGCLRARLIEVRDLGLNVAAERFVEEAIAFGAEVIALSAMMVHTARGEKGCPRVCGLLQERGLRRRIKVVVGGAPFTFHPELARMVGADAWAADALTGGRVIEEAIREVQR